MWKQLRRWKLVAVILGVLLVLLVTSIVAVLDAALRQDVSVPSTGSVGEVEVTTNL